MMTTIPGPDRGSSSVELAVVMAAVLALLALMLTVGTRWLAAQAALAAAQRVLEIAQAPDGLAADVTATADRIARSSKIVTDVATAVSISTAAAGMPATVTVTVTVTTVLGTTVSRSAAGALLGFVPQHGPPARADGAVGTSPDQQLLSERAS